MRKIGKWTALLLSAVLVMATQTRAAAATELIPVGQTVGIELKTGEVTVVGFSEQDSGAEEVGLQRGDVVESINGIAIHAAEQITPMLTGAPAKITVLRSGRRQEYLVEPEAAGDRWCLGLLVQDTMTGIGTVTYYDPSSGRYGALGHGVSRRNGEALVTMVDGELVASSVVDVEKSSKGRPGSLRGALEHTQIGTVEQNTPAGIFGTLARDALEPTTQPAVTVGEARCGAASILSNISGTRTETYQVEIEQLNAGDEQGRNLLLRVTDPALLDKTGGIVQGMSGSPILQDGKLVGAVTHVLVDDPSRGYGILIENMLDAAA